MDVVVADITARFGMLLSRSQGAKLGCVLMLDFTYVVIPVFGGEERRLYRETRFVKTITKNAASNSPVQSQEKDDFACFTLHDNAELAEDNQKQLTLANVITKLKMEEVWKCFFDRAYSKEGIGVGFLLISPGGNIFPFSFKLEFEATNNMELYESLIIALQTTKQMGVKSISAFGNSEIIIKQIKDHYQTKHPRLRAYKNEVWDMIENFFEAFNIQFIPIDENRLADSLAVAASTFKPPINPRLRYEVEMRHRPFVTDNVKNWQVFEDEQQIKEFSTMVEEFQGTKIDQDEEDIVENVGASGFKDSIANQMILQLKDNFLPKGLGPLERLFN